jgi:hypothetical protein
LHDAPLSIYFFLLALDRVPFIYTKFAPDGFSDLVLTFTQSKTDRSLPDVLGTLTGRCLRFLCRASRAEMISSPIVRLSAEGSFVKLHTAKHKTPIFDRGNHPFFHVQSMRDAQDCLIW